MSDVNRWRLEVFLRCPKEQALEVYELVAQTVTESGILNVDDHDDYSAVSLERAELLPFELMHNIARDERLPTELWEQFRR